LSETKQRQQNNDLKKLHSSGFRVEKYANEIFLSPFPFF
jgi:hypothetical protein